MIAHYRRATKWQKALGAVLVVLLFIFGLCESQSALRAQDAKANEKPAAEVPPASVKIAGVCRDENGKPLKDIRVALYRENYRKLTTERLKEVTTDGEGRFALTDLPAPQTKDGVAYVLVVTASGRASAICRGCGQEASKALTITLPPATALRGRVTDSTGKPVAGAEVWTDGLFNGPLEGVHSGRTDADGRYVIADLRPWDVAKQKPAYDGKGGATMLTGCCLSVRHPNYAERRPLYKRVPDSIDVVLEPAAVIEGRVTDQVSGKPAVGVLVSIQSTNVSGGNCFSQTRTDEEGKYRLTSLAAGSYNFWADALDRACAAIDTFAVPGGKTVTAPELRLVEGGWLEGHIVDAESGKPVNKDSASGASLYVGLYGPSRPKSGAGCASSAVDERGYFRIHVAPGLQFPYIMGWDVWERTQRREYFEKGVQVKSGEVASVVFRVLPKALPADPNPAPVLLKVPVEAEREAAAAIRRLGGWYEVDPNNHVIEVNLVYHESPQGQRLDNQQTNTDEALHVVKDFPRLRKLLLQKGQATDDGLRSVSGLKDLETLMIWDAEKVSDAGVKHLAGLTKLTTIHINAGHLGDGSLRVFAQLPNLRRLSLQGNDFTDAGLEDLAKLKKLQSLWIGMNRTSYTDAGLHHLSGLTTLKELELQDSSVDDRGVTALKDMHELRTLYLGGIKGDKDNAVTGASLETLLGMTKLERLTLTHFSITLDGAKRILALPSLNEFSVGGEALDQKARNELNQLKRPGLRLYLTGPSVE